MSDNTGPVLGGVTRERVWGFADPMPLNVEMAIKSLAVNMPYGTWTVSDAMYTLARALQSVSRVAGACESPAGESFLECVERLVSDAEEKLK